MKLVLLHALPLDERMWEPQREALAGHEAVAPNLYRLGSSMDEWAKGVLDRAEGSLVAVGASMGGYCALAIARRAPERLRGLVLAGSRAEADPPERRPVREESIRLIREQGAEGLWREMEQSVFRGADGTIRAIALEQRPADLEAAVAAIRDRADARDVVASLRVPLLVAVGDADPLVPAEEARALAESAPDGRLVLLEGAGHLPSLERPAEFNSALAEFLDSLP